MDPQTQNDQTGDIDPLELEDQELPDEEVGELAHIEDDASVADGDAKVIEEEKELVKELDAVAVPDVDDDAAPTAKKSSHLVSKDLIDRELTVEDLYDEGRI
jgi:hypothetical protein